MSYESALETTRLHYAATAQRESARHAEHARECRDAHDGEDATFWADVSCNHATQARLWLEVGV